MIALMKANQLLAAGFALTIITVEQHYDMAPRPSDYADPSMIIGGWTMPNPTVTTPRNGTPPGSGVIQVASSAMVALWY